MYNILLGFRGGRIGRRQRGKHLAAWPWHVTWNTLSFALQPIPIWPWLGQIILANAVKKTLHAWHIHPIKILEPMGSDPAIRVARTATNRVIGLTGATERWRPGACSASVVSEGTGSISCRSGGKSGFEWLGKGGAPKKTWGLPSQFIEINQGVNGHTTRTPPGYHTSHKKMAQHIWNYCWQTRVE